MVVLAPLHHSLPTRRHLSQLDQVIAPEIRRDRFSRMIQQIGAKAGLRHILEIGSSSGDGSTAAFVAGMRESLDPPTLHCMEVSLPRFHALEQRYQENPLVRCYRLSTVPLDHFPSVADVESWYRAHRPRLRRPSLDLMLRWRQQDIDYLTEHGLSSWGIREIRERHSIDTFDAVLIDGSEFLGEPELAEVYGAHFLLLDDILSYKNHRNHMRLRADPAYRLLAASRWVRNGFAAFERR